MTDVLPYFDFMMKPGPRGMAHDALQSLTNILPPRAEPLGVGYSIYMSATICICNWKENNTYFTIQLEANNMFLPTQFFDMSNGQNEEIRIM